MATALAMVASVIMVAYAFPADAAASNDGYMTLGGTGYLSADSFGHGSDDLDVIFYAAADDWSNGNLQSVVAHWGGSQSSQALRVQFSTKGHLQLVVRDSSGKGHVYSAWDSDLNLTNGRGYWFRIRFDAKSAAGSTTKFYVSNNAITTAPLSVSWGAAVRTANDGAVTLNGAGTKWIVGAANGGNDDNFKGDLGYVGLWRSGWSTNGGTQAINLNFRATGQASGNRATWTENGHSWTAHGNWSYNEPTDGSPPPPPPSSSTNHMHLSGAKGTHVITDSLSNGKGDMEFQFYVALDDYTSGTQTVLARWPGAADRSKIRVQFTSSGLLQLLVKDESGGSSQVYNGPTASELGLADGAGRWFRIRLDHSVNGGSEARFWSSGSAATANPANISWGGSDKVAARPTAVTPRNNFGIWEIGSYDRGASGRMAGDVYYAAFWRSGFASSGTKVFELDFRDSSAAQSASPEWSSWVDTEGNEWTAKGSWTYMTDDSAPPPPPGNEAPTAHTDNYTITEGETLVITKSKLLSNDTDPENDPLSVVSVASPSSQGRTVSPSGTSWEYTAGANAGGSVDTITYTIEDSAGNRDSGQAKVTIENSSDPTGYDVIIRPGDNIASIVANKPAGTSFYVKAGKYRLQEIKPKDGMTFVAEPGAILSGSKKLTQFSQSGGLWVANNQTQGSGGKSQGSEWGKCDGGYSMCVYPEQLFIGNQLLWQVSSKSQVGPGKWYFDYGNNQIWFADNPTGKTVETSVAESAFYGNADNVHIEGFVIERYATPGRRGTIQMRTGRTGTPGKNWTIKNNEIRYNHGYGIKVENGTDVIGNDIHHMGQMGIGGADSSNILIKNNELDHNCVSGFQCFGFGGGALKLNGINNITLQGNYVHDNPSHGLHMDQGSTNVVYEDNVIVNNQGNGIHHEISGSAIVRNNVIENNGFRADGARLFGIMVLSSHDVEVYGNTLDGNANGILGRQDSRTSVSKLTNLWVHDNDVTLDGSARVGLAIDGISDTSYFTSKNNRYTSNDYTFQYGNSNFKPFKWINGAVDVATWKSKGMDTAGTFHWQ